MPAPVLKVAIHHCFILIPIHPETAKVVANICRCFYSKCLLKSKIGNTMYK